MFSNICGGCPWNVLMTEYLHFHLLSSYLCWHLQVFESDLGSLVSESFLVSDEFRFFLFYMVSNSLCDSRFLSIFSAKNLIIPVLFLLSSLRYFNLSLSSFMSDLLLLTGFANLSSNFFKI